MVAGVVLLVSASFGVLFVVDVVSSNSTLARALYGSLFITTVTAGTPR